MALGAPDQQHLEAAHGYIELGMLHDANAELEMIEPLCRHVPEILLARMFIYRGLEHWDLMEIVARSLVDSDPSEQVYWIDLAFATRRANSVQAARAVLTKAVSMHPGNGTIHFNLACYEAQLGNLERAKAHLTAATRINGRFAGLALDDPDLEPLWRT